MTPAIETAIRAFVGSNRDAETRFLAAIVMIPSDNPPGDCDPSAAAVARLLEGLGFAVQRHKVPDPLAKAAGMISATNLIVPRRAPAARRSLQGDRGRGVDAGGFARHRMSRAQISSATSQTQAWLSASAASSAKCRSRARITPPGQGRSRVAQASAAIVIA